ncbi:MAG: chromosome segregation SMC family protein [Solirubrobacteraceae bacterium]
MSVYLRSITLKGFKSFPERTRLEFGPGVSVIVGPNGSGKSNVTDAVLWALGEQSPVAVRGQVMQDVIFAGAPGRQASRAAEVELVLEDSEGRLGLGTSEISVLRRLDRGGEGEYRMAGARCRLVDVVELLSDTGLGKEMHSVISQGRVESIITSKPRDRRLLIEEAAGLGKHRKRRRRAQLKLERTQDNLDRALDVEREARTRLRPLKRQAEAAELHARLERQSLQARWELARDDLRSHLEVSEHARTRAAASRARREQLERELEAVARRREAAEEALAARSAKRDELSRRCFAAQSAGERVAYRAEAVRVTSSAIEARLDRAEQQLGAVTQSAPQEAADSGQAARIAALQDELAALEREREQEAEKAVAELEGQQAAVRARVLEQDGAVEAAQRSRAEAEERLERARESVREAQRAVERARLEAVRVGGELAAVNQFLRSHAAVPGGASLLADELEVDSGFELAVAAALDGRLGAAVVVDLEAAGDLLDRAGAEGGRALVTDLVARAEAHAAGAPGRSPAEGAEPLAEHVRGSGQAAVLARGLLRDTWLVGTLDAVDPAFRGTAVTCDGRVLSTSAAELRQAPAVGEERILAQRNLRERLIAESESAAGAELAAGAGVEKAAADQAAAQNELEEAIALHRRAVSARDEILEEGRRIAALVERRRSSAHEGPAEDRRRRLLAELRAEQDSLARLEQERAQRLSHIDRLQGMIEAGTALLPQVLGLLNALEGMGQAIAAQREVFEQALAADQEAGEHVAAELRACAGEEAPLQTQLHKVSEELTDAEVALQRARDRTEEAERELGQLATQLGLEPGPAEGELSPEERETLHSRLERLTRRREQLGPVNPLAGQEYEEAVAHVEELEHQRVDLETALRELEKLISDTDRQIRETFEQTFQAAAENFQHVVAQLFPGGRGRLRLVSEREGPARVLGGQAAETDGSEGVAEEEEGLQEAPEEDLQGVEIEINPAGKDMRRLSLLSGGEKSLTALAFLFAVFLARPCPFYILDEVEAALDDINIDRFLGLLRAYSQRAQFIVVTHQRRTMEAADSLYGVSMGGDGLSKVISRRLPGEAESSGADASEAAAPSSGVDASEAAAPDPPGPSAEAAA